MKKIRTELAYYKFNSILQTTSEKIEWYVLETIGTIEKGRCFTEVELTQFLSYISCTKINFPNNYIIHDCSEESTPFCTANVTRQAHPSNLILRKTPCLNNHTSKCMDIKLCDTQGNFNHSYNLEFDIIGERISFKH